MSHNGALIPISCLAIETLVQVFSSCMIDDDEANISSVPPTAFRISHVCRHWRTIAFEYSALWSEISLRWKEPLISHYLDRSGSSLLSFYIINIFDRRIPVVPIVSSNFHRTRLLHIDHHEAISLLDTLFSENTPTSLQVIRILSNGEHCGVFSRDVVAESLRVLKLQETKLSLSSPLLASQITSLSLTSTDIGSAEDIERSFPISIFHHQSRLLDALRRLPSLQRLSLSPVCSSDAFFSSYHANDPRVDLPNLQYLRIEDDLDQMEVFTAWMQLPPSTELDINVRKQVGYRYLPDSTVPRAAAILSRHLAPGSQNHGSFRTLGIQWNQARRMHQV